MATSLVLLHLRELGRLKHISRIHEAMLGPYTKTDARARAFRNHPVADMREQEATTAEDPFDFDRRS